MSRAETTATATNRFLAGLPLDQDPYASSLAAVVRSLADQVDAAKGSTSPNIVRGVPTLARQLAETLAQLRDHFADPEPLTDRDRLLVWLNEPHQTDELVDRLGLSEVEARWLWTEDPENAATHYPGSPDRADLRRADIASGHFHSVEWWAERDAENARHDDGADPFEVVPTVEVEPEPVEHFHPSPQEPEPYPYPIDPGPVGPVSIARAFAPTGTTADDRAWFGLLDSYPPEAWHGLLVRRGCTDVEADAIIGRKS